MTNNSFIQILQDEQFIEQAREIIPYAIRYIYIASFKLERSTKPRGRQLIMLFDELATKAAAGLDVRILTNKQGQQGHVPHTNAFAIRWLRDNGAKVRYLTHNRLCHAKLLIIDKSVAIIGSHNLSINSCRANFELSLLTNDRPTIQTLTERFEGIWNSANDVR